MQRPALLGLMLVVSFGVSFGGCAYGATDTGGGNSDAGARTLSPTSDPSSSGTSAAPSSSGATAGDSGLGTPTPSPTATQAPASTSAACDPNDPKYLGELLEASDPEPCSPGCPSGQCCAVGLVCLPI